MNLRKPWRWGAATLISGIVLLAACDGENLFDADQNPFIEPRVSVSAPEDAFAGDTIGVAVTAFAGANVARIDVSFRGAVNKDTSITTAATQNVSAVIKVGLPELLTDTLLIISAQAIDQQGRVSKVRGDTLSVVGPPAIVTVDGADSASANSTYNLTVRAFGSRPITQLAFTIRGATNRDTTINIVPPANDVTRSIAIPIPASPADTVLSVTIVARDASGFSGGATVIIPMRVSAGAVPVVTSVSATPNPARPGGIVDVRAVATGVRPITKLTFRFRGAVNQDVEVPVDPARTNATIDAQVTLPQVVSDTILTITVVAEDASANLSALTAASTTTVRVSDITSPSVSAAAAPGTTSAGRTVQVRVTASDNVALRTIGFAAVNPAGDTVGTTPTLVTTAGLSKDTIFNFTVPSTLTPRTLRVVGIAVDASGRRGTSAPVTLVIADSAAPSITITAPTATTTMPLGDSVRVAFRVVDPTGIKTIRLRGESTRVDSLGPTTTVLRYQEKVITFPAVPGTPLPTDTTLIRYLQATADTVSEFVDIIIEAEDSIGNEGMAQQSITVGGPRVQLVLPAAPTTVTPGNGLVLRAFAIDRASGIDSVKIMITGAQTATIPFLPGCAAATCTPNGLPSADSVTVSSTYTVGAALGTLTISAMAWNGNRIAGISTAVSVTVGAVAAGDTVRPRVSQAIVTDERIELTDTITVNVNARDLGSGLARAGVIVTATPSGSGPVLTLYRDSIWTGLSESPAPFKFTLKDMGYTEVNLVSLPRTITLDVQAFAKDMSGNCGANVTATLGAIACDSVFDAGTGRYFYSALNTPANRELVEVVAGFGRPLPTSGSVIADIVVDNTPGRPRLFLSNHNFNRIDVLELDDSTFATPVNVGSEPWGMFIDNSNTRLIVANSGGTNLSFVNTTGALNTALTEMPAERVLTPNAVLFDVIIVLGEDGTRYTSIVRDFSDRPQFVAQDASGILLYSTKPTEAATDGTVRRVDTTLPRMESKILFTRSAIASATNQAAIAHIDSLLIARATPGFDDQVNIFDHIPGTTIVISSGFMELSAAIASVQGQGSDIEAFAGAWDLEEVGLSDTTFIAASGDRQFVGFGEGATGPFASVWLWHAASQGLSDAISVEDLVGNAAERVTGIALNDNGSIGAARGAASAYFFSNDVDSEGELRLQGIFSQGVTGGNGGVALHPDHQYDLVDGSNPTTLAFIATSNQSIKIVDTFHFRERGEIQIKDNIVGPLRAALPLAAENAALAECDQIWVKLYGVTDAGNAVIINVRKKDVINPIITAAACPL